ncbi:MAG: hypothetical protein KDA80_06200, partial [Planctomycetaceae bacterium]|nr:hypothetical protein [Planctomycetaceae bacterium]
MRSKFLMALAALLSFSSLTTFASAQDEPIYDEDKIPPYKLPDPLTSEDGEAITTAKQWRSKRRPELLRLFEEQVYGRAPKAPAKVESKILSERDVFNGKAIQKQVEITLADGDSPLTMTLLLYVPKQDQPAPAFLGLNFRGNHAVTDDSHVMLNSNWMRNGPGVVDHTATEETRGVAASRWPIEMIIDRGYALGTIYYGDIDPDFDDEFQNGIHPFCYGEGQTKPAADQWGSIAAWAWGLSRILDYLETEPQIDAKHVAVLGHSRLGKTSLWAGAADERFALVISNNSGCGGAALNKRVIGESVHRINTSFPHWFCDNFVKYNSNEAALTFDQHELIALMAPRPVYVASAVEDTWADPKGEYLSCVYADPVYRLLGTDGLGGDTPIVEPPAVDQPRASGRIGYHIRTGKHDITRYDWEQYLNFADRHFR